MKIKQYTLAIIIFVVVFGGIGLAKVFGLWNPECTGGSHGNSNSIEHNDDKDETHNSTQSNTNEHDDEHEDHEHSEEGFKVSGEKTFDDLIEYGMKLDKIEAILAMDVDDNSLLVKDFCHENGLRFSEMKMLLQEYADTIVVDSSEGTDNEEIDDCDLDNNNDMKVYEDNDENEYFSNDDKQVDEDKDNGAQENIYKDGYYTGIARAYRPNLTVGIEIKNDNIVLVEILSHNETPGFYEESFDVIPDMIVDIQSLDIDTITGATRTGEGILKAVEDALLQARM